VASQLVGARIVITFIELVSWLVGELGCKICTLKGTVIPLFYNNCLWSFYVGNRVTVSNIRYTGGTNMNTKITYYFNIKN
jgi:hypothetical protein